MKTNLKFIIGVFFLTISIFGQPQSNEIEGIQTRKEILKNNYITKPGFMMHNGEELPVVLVLDNNKTYTISDGELNGNKMLLNTSELEAKFLNITKEGTNQYSNSMILISDLKPYLITVIKNDFNNAVDTLVVPLIEENNYLKMQGLPYKRTVVSGKTIIKFYPIIDTKTTDYVCHIALMK